MSDLGEALNHCLPIQGVHAKQCALCRARSSTDRMVVSEAAYPGSIPGGRTRVLTIDFPETFGSLGQRRRLSWMRLKRA
jgi:hypothetical protein